MEALAKHGFNVDDKALKPRSPSKLASLRSQLPRHTIALRDVDCPPIRYRIRDGGALFLHRKSCFEAVGLERVVMTQGRRSFSAVVRFALVFEFVKAVAQMG